ncbi:MAG: dihydrofolate reductase family protein [Rhizomicrobium sp.]
MRKLVLKMSMSLDGFVGAADGGLEWMFKSMDPAGTAWTVDKISGAGLHIMGSRTFQDMTGWWPTSKESFAAPMNEIPKAVFSRSGKLGESTQALQDAIRLRGKEQGALSPHAHSWAEAEVIGGDLKAGIERLKKQDGNFILAHGGASFARSLIATGLVDEYQLLIFPVALGAGLAIVSGLDAPLRLTLIEHRTFATGVAAHVYQPA